MPKLKKKQKLKRKQAKKRSPKPSKLYKLKGDILHPGAIEVKAKSLNNALDLAEDGIFTIKRESDRHLTFEWDGEGYDDEAEDIG